MASTPERRPAHRLDFERRVLILGLASGLPGTLLALLLLWFGPFALRTQVAFTILVFAVWGLLVYRLRERVVRPIQTLSNMMAALLEGDYSIRTRHGPSEDALGLAFHEINSLGQTLRDQRLGPLDPTGRLPRGMEAIK